jgi:hypothetical protein
MTPHERADELIRLAKMQRCILTRAKINNHLKALQDQLDPGWTDPELAAKIKEFLDIWTGVKMKREIT